MRVLIFNFLFVSPFLFAQVPGWVLNEKNVVCQDLDADLNIPIGDIKEVLLFELAGKVSLSQKKIVRGNVTLSDNNLNYKIVSFATGISKNLSGKVKFYESDTLVCAGYLR